MAISVGRELLEERDHLRTAEIGSQDRPVLVIMRET